MVGVLVAVRVLVRNGVLVGDLVCVLVRVTEGSGVLVVVLVTIGVLVCKGGLIGAFVEVEPDNNVA